MTYRMPPLNALRAFEAAARHLSFKKAAEELHVTPAAISHQVKTLEQHLGIALFRRLPRRLELSEAAAAAWPKLNEGFASLAEAAKLLKSREGELAVAAAPAFTSKWLLPRLPRFHAAHPEIDLRISASMDLTVVRRSPGAEPAGQRHDADLSIRFGTAASPDHEVELLHAPLVTPMCSPKLLQIEPGLQQPSDLSSQTLLHDDSVYFDHDDRDWAVWLRAAGVEGIDATRGSHFSHAALAIDAAADGLGVALSLPFLAASEIAAGRLVIPFPLQLPCRFGYYLLRPKAKPATEEATTFSNWLRAEVQATRTA